MSREDKRRKEDGLDTSNSFIPETEERKLTKIRLLMKKGSVNTCT